VHASCARSGPPHDDPRRADQTHTIADDECRDIAECYSWGRFAIPFNFSGHPTLTLPCALTTEERYAPNRRPLAFQIVANRCDETTLCQLGHAYEQATRRATPSHQRPFVPPGLIPPTPLPPTPLPPPEIPLPTDAQGAEEHGRQRAKRARDSSS